MNLLAFSLTNEKSPSPLISGVQFRERRKGARRADHTLGAEMSFHLWANDFDPSDYSSKECDGKPLLGASI